MLFVLSSRCLSGWKRTDKVLYLSLTSSTEAVSGRLRTELKFRQKGKSWGDELTDYRKPSCSMALPSLADWLMRCRCENKVKVKRASAVGAPYFGNVRVSLHVTLSRRKCPWNIIFHHGRSTKCQASLFGTVHLWRTAWSQGTKFAFGNLTVFITGN